MNGMTTKEVAEIWGITPSQVQLLCANGRSHTRACSVWTYLGYSYRHTEAQRWGVAKKIIIKEHGDYRQA